MKVYGSLKEIVVAAFRSQTFQQTLEPNQTVTYTADRVIQLPQEDAASTLVSRTSTDTLTNKSISGSTNTLSNIPLGTATGTLAATNGGTGVSSTATFPTSGVIVTEAAAETLTNKSISGSTNTITNVSLTTGVTGTLPIANGGTNGTSATTGFNNLSPITTKGDLITSNGTNNIRLAAGADGTVLSADSTQTSGLKYVTALTNPMTAIGDLIVGGTAGAATRLATGTANQVITTNGTTTAWGSAQRTAASTTPSGATTLTSASGTFQVMVPSASITVTLDNSFSLGNRITIANSSGTNLITVAANDASVIRTIFPHTVATFFSTTNSPAAAVNWEVEGMAGSSVIAYTPTFGVGWGTASQITVYYQRIGDTVRITGTFRAGTTTSGVGNIGLPLGLSLDTAKIANTSNNQARLGSVGLLDSGGPTAVWSGALNSYLTYNGTATVLALANTTATSVFTGNIVSNFAPTNTYIMIDATVPISGWTVSKG